MEAKLEKKSINFYKSLFNTSQTHEETMEMIVPDAMPDILRIVDTDGTVILRSKEAEAGRTTVGGVVNTTVLYMPEGDEGLMKLELKIPFTAAYENSAIDSSTRLTANAALSSIDGRILNPRKILVRADVLTNISGFKPAKLELGAALGEGTRDIEVLEEKSNIQMVSDVREKTFVISDEYSLPASKPQIDEILKTEFSISVDDTKTVGSKLIIKGSVAVSVLYLAKDGNLYTAEFTTAFSQIAELDAEGEAEFSVTVMPTGAYFDRAEGQNGDAMITMELHAVAQIVMIEPRNVEYIADTYSTVYDLSHKEENYSVDTVDKPSLVRVNVAHTVDTPAQARNIICAKAYTGKTNRIESDDGCKLDTTIMLTLLFNSADGRLLSVSERIKAETPWEKPCENATYAANAVCNDIYASPAPSGIDVRLNVDFTVTATEAKTINTVTEIQFDEEKKKDVSANPSVIVKRVNIGEDTLWKLAKRYNSTQKLITEANELENPELENGKLLIIPKKR